MESNKEGKEALTAGQILSKYVGDSLKVNGLSSYYFIVAMEEFALLKVAEKESEMIEYMKGQQESYEAQVTGLVSELAEKEKEIERLGLTLKKTAK